ncbi:MAG TPA: hypothetical protein PLR18_03215 [bacterium]|nr:hypothetical protein [bacterium]
MKRIVSFLLMALLAMSATLCWGADKKQTEASSILMGVVVDPQIIQPGERASVTVKTSPGCVIVCNGDTVDSAFFLEPKQTTNYVVRALGKKPGEEGVQSFTVTVIERRKLRGEVGPFKIGKSGIHQLEPGAKSVESLKQLWLSFIGSDTLIGYNVRYYGSSDKQGRGTLKRNTQLAGERSENIRDYLGVNGEINKRVEVDDRKVVVEAEETDVSFYRRLGRSAEFKGGAQAKVIATASKTDTLRIKIAPKTDRLRIVAGGFWFNEAPQFGGGLYLPLVSDSLGSAYDMQLRGYYGGGNVDRPGPSDWAVSMQVDSRVGKRFYLGPILAVGQHFDYRSGLGDQLDVSLGLVAQWRPKKWLAFEGAVLYTHRVNAWCGPDRKKMGADREFVNGMAGIVFMF